MVSGNTTCLLTWFADLCIGNNAHHRKTDYIACFYSLYLSSALIVDTASDLLLWSKGKHVLVPGVLCPALVLGVSECL